MSGSKTKKKTVAVDCRNETIPLVNHRRLAVFLLQKWWFFKLFIAHKILILHHELFMIIIFYQI